MHDRKRFAYAIGISKRILCFTSTRNIGRLGVIAPKKGCKPVVFVTLSDLHVGSTAAIWPPDFERVEGRGKVPQNPLQEQVIWPTWLDACRKIKDEIAPPGYKRICVINGDAIEGRHHGGRELMTSEEADQFDALLDVLKPLQEVVDEFLVVRGTECHSGHSEDALATVLRSRSKAEDKLRVHYNGVRMFWRHHMPTTSRVHLESAALKNMMVQEVAEAARAKHPTPEVLTMAHRHVPDLLTDGDWIIGVTGPWKGHDRFTHKVAGHGSFRPAMLTYTFHKNHPYGQLPEPHLHKWAAKPPPYIEINDL